MEQLPSEVSYELNMYQKRVQTVREASFDLEEGEKIVGMFLGAAATFSDSNKN